MELRGKQKSIRSLNPKSLGGGEREAFFLMRIAIAFF
jgi:hypothetical protein